MRDSLPINYSAARHNRTDPEPVGSRFPSHVPSGSTLDGSLDCFVSQPAVLAVHSGRQPTGRIRRIPSNDVQFPANDEMPEEGLEPPTRGL